eukprot:TRINITY_DN16352_c0_g1_i1.p1 TRINITY_DN16352_c0_g1~~TRINITY_DN16352_c0_g1_i1.p1  ORF type:complete len:667 (+),score=251.20 TRINITY_DN16352_c0_g1_i1:24-2003(+)
MESEGYTDDGDYSLSPTPAPPGRTSLGYVGEAPLSAPLFSRPLVAPQEPTSFARPSLPYGAQEDRLAYQEDSPAYADMSRVQQSPFSSPSPSPLSRPPPSSSLSPSPSSPSTHFSPSFSASPSPLPSSLSTDGYNTFSNEGGRGGMTSAGYGDSDGYGGGYGGSYNSLSSSSSAPCSSSGYPKSPGACASGSEKHSSAGMSSRQKPITLTVHSEVKNVKFDTSQNIKLLWELQGNALGKVGSIRDLSVRATPVSIVVMVDKSSSMKGEKLNLVKKTLCFFVENLKPTDSFGLYVFDKTVTCLHPIRLLSPVDKVKALKRILGIEVGLWTNIETAIEVGCRSARKAGTVHGEEKPLTSLLFLTDGLPTIGAKTKDAILSKTGETDSFLIHTFGYGTPHDADTLKALSQKGKGQYFFMETEADVRETFTKYLSSIITVSAVEVKLSVQALGSHFVSHRPLDLVSSPGSSQPSQITFEIGAVGEKKVSVMTEIHVPALEKPMEDGEEAYIAEAQVEFVNLGTGARDVILDVICITRTSGPTEPGNSSGTIQLEILRMDIIDSIALANETAHKGNLRDAQVILANSLLSIDRSGLRGTEINTLRAKLEELTENFRNPSTYEARGSYAAASVQSDFNAGYSVESETSVSIHDAYAGYNAPSFDD